MDNKNTAASLAKTGGHDIKTVQRFLDGMSAALLEHCSALDTVAITGFGKFIPSKIDETVVTDHSSGHRMLLPPEIIIGFKAATILKKKILAAK